MGIVVFATIFWESVLLLIQQRDLSFISATALTFISIPSNQVIDYCVSMLSVSMSFLMLFCQQVCTFSHLIRSVRLLLSCCHFSEILNPKKFLHLFYFFVLFNSLLAKIIIYFLSCFSSNYNILFSLLNLMWLYFWNIVAIFIFNKKQFVREKIIRFSFAFLLRFNAIF